MKVFRSFTIIIILALIIGRLFGAVKGLALIAFFLGVDELTNAKLSYDNGNKRMAIVYSLVGFGACICSILSFTNII